MLNSDKIKDFANKFGVRDIQITHSYEDESSASLELSLSGLERLVTDIERVKVSDVPKIKAIDIKPNEAIVLKYNMGALSYSELCQIVTNVKEIFHKNPLVALPDDIELMTMPVDELENIKNYIGDLILCSDFDGIVKAQKQISSARS
ncbi:MAG: hypothetical protein IJR89_06580 [Clostridia bacterium]|nr:hypothetical protein [Clostridia bacterium]